MLASGLWFLMVEITTSGWFTANLKLAPPPKLPSGEHLLHAFAPTFLPNLYELALFQSAFP